MDELKNVTLGQYLNARRIVDVVEQREIDVKLAVKVAYEVSLHLNVAHDRGIAYSFINPNNIIVTSYCLFTLNQFPDKTSFFGPYHSPEHMSTPVPACDIYSIGMLLYTMLTGGSSVVSQSLREQNPNVSSELEKIIMRCLDRNPEQRYQNASELIRALEQLEL